VELEAGWEQTKIDREDIQITLNLNINEEEKQRL
jgi:hypothetical protein